MIHPIPSGTRDVLPDEMRELRAITESLRGVFEARGYGEVYTPALEYASELEPTGAPPAYRLFDERGEPMVLRTDMTVPIARVVGTRYADAQPPLRFAYFAHAYRAVRAQRGQPREFLQAGIELVGAPAPEGTVEALSLLAEALSAAGLREYRIGLGDASLYPALLAAHGVADGARERILYELATRDFVGLEREVRAAGLPGELVTIPQTRGPELPDVGEPVAGMRAVRDGLPADVAERVIFDLGLSRGLGYYTGAIFEVYDPALGAPVGGGGRYDDLLGRFGRALPAVGFALNVERLHLALTGEEGRAS
ncbi:MAG TPA: ATP phosphoribosyltransferase regulatory subunit [Solirubrobacteraceae bacterium]|nr:ATP phosphoribosyltransferase regulatory subunit [Solirubrobacteraceae bacterium]